MHLLFPTDKPREMTEILTLKQEIAQEYIKKFKDELGWFKSLAVLPIESKIKEIIASNKDIGEGFDQIEELGAWKNIINVVSPKTSEKIYQFVKEKKEILAIKNSQQELASLKQEIISGVVQPTVDQNPEKNISEESSSDIQEEHPIGQPDEQTEVPPQESPDQAPDQSSQESHLGRNLLIGGGSGGAAATGYGVGMNRLRKSIDIKEPPIEIQVKKFKSTLDEFATVLERNAQSSNVRYTKRMRSNMEQSAKIFREAMDNVDPESMTTMMERSKLGEKFPLASAKAINLSPKAYKALEGVSPQAREKIVKMKNPKEIKIFLKSEGIGVDIGDDVLKILSSADDVVQIKSMMRIMKGMKNARFLKVMKGAQGMGVIDLLFLGFDAYQFMEARDMALMEKKVNQIRAKNMMTQAMFHLSVGLSSFFVEAGILIAYGGAIGGPRGIAIGLGIGLISATVDRAADEYYFDVKNFYLQNKENYLKQDRTQLKQAILQTTHNLKFGDTSFNEKVATAIKETPYRQKVETLKDAWEALISTEACEEKENGSYKYPLLLEQRNTGRSKEDYISKFSAEQKKQYSQEEQEMQKHIQTRMAYIQKSYAQERILYGMKNANGMKYIAEILAQSSAYDRMLAQGKRDNAKDFASNKEAYKKTMMQTGSWSDQEFAKIDAFRSADPYRFRELYRGAQYYKEQLIDITPEEEDYQECQTTLSHIHMIEAYYEYISFGTPREEDEDIGTFSFDTMDFNYLHYTLLHLDPNGFVANQLDEEQVKQFFLYGKERNATEATISISDSLSQNIIYRIAKEINGYTGPNDMDALRAYFSVDKDDAIGLYYKDKRYINNDNAIDLPIDFSSLDDIKEVKDTQVTQLAKGIIGQMLYEEKTTYRGGSNGGQSFSYYKRKDFIDTPTESLDETLMNEVETSMTKIIEEELIYKTPAKKKAIEEQIISYIQTQSSSASGKPAYVELPFRLLIPAKKAGIGDLQHHVFSYQDGKIVACSNTLYAALPVRFDQTKTEVVTTYIDAGQEHSTPEIQAHIDYVDTAKKRCVDLLSYQRKLGLVGGFEKSLSIPTEIKQSYRKKIQEREDLKKRLSSLDPLNAKIALTEGYEEYHEYFETTYIAILMALSDKERDSYELDSIEDYGQISSMAGEISNRKIDDQGKVDMSKIQEHRSDDKKEVFGQVLTTQKISGKTVSERARIDHDRGVRAARILLTSFLEVWMFTMDDHGRLEEISLANEKYATNVSGKGRKKEYSVKEYYTGLLAPKITENVAKYPVFEADKHQIVAAEIDMSKVKIIALTQGQSEVSSHTKAIQQAIEAEHKKDDIRLQRGNITFDHTKNQILSRDSTTAIEFLGKKELKFYHKNYTQEFVKIAGLDSMMTIEEGIRTANFINRLKGKYLKDNPEYAGKFFFGKTFGALYAEAEGTGKIENDIDILSSSAIKKRFTSLEDDNEKTKFLTYINALK